MIAKPARLDPNGTEKPLTRLTRHVKSEQCVMSLYADTYVGDDGKKVDLYRRICEDERRFGA